MTWEKMTTAIMVEAWAFLTIVPMTTNAEPLSIEAAAAAAQPVAAAILVTGGVWFAAKIGRAAFRASGWAIDLAIEAVGSSSTDVEDTPRVSD